MGALLALIKTTHAYRSNFINIYRKYTMLHCRNVNNCLVIKTNLVVSSTY